jgi:hypothetical protein
MMVSANTPSIFNAGAQRLQQVSTDAFEVVATVSEAGEVCRFLDCGDHILGKEVDACWGDATEGSIGAEALQSQVGYAPRQSFDRAKPPCYQRVVNGGAFLKLQFR